MEKSMALAQKRNVHMLSIFLKCWHLENLFSRLRDENGEALLQSRRVNPKTMLYGSGETAKPD